MASSISGDPPLVVAFANLSTGSPTAQLWTFGDGSASFDVHPSHVYRERGLYTVTLAVWGDEGWDVRVKQDLIAVGALAGAVANQDRGSLTEQPAWWVTLAISPWLAGAWYLYDRINTPRASLERLVREGRTLAALVAARSASTSVGSLDLVVERWLREAVTSRRRANEATQEGIDRSSRALDGLREALLLESLVRDASPERLAAFAASVQERLQEFASTLDALGRED